MSDLLTGGVFASDDLKTGAHAPLIARVSNDATDMINSCLRKTAFLSHLYIKTIILPRQARDKHRENSKKDAVFRTVEGENDRYERAGLQF